MYSYTRQTNYTLWLIVVDGEQKSTRTSCTLLGLQSLLHAYRIYAWILSLYHSLAFDHHTDGITVAYCYHIIITIIIVIYMMMMIINY